MAKPDRKIRKSEKNSSFHGVILKILRKKRRPMSPVEVFNDMKKMRRFTGKTPYKTIQVILNESRYMIKIKRGLYKLSKTKYENY